MRKAALLILLGWTAGMPGAELRDSEWKGWQTHVLRNGLIELHVAPQLGGRIIQYSLAGHHFLWWNPKLAGQAPPESGLGPGNSWLNWGGDKLWPAPQGWDGPEQWPGPPDRVLDGSPHSVSAIEPTGPSVAMVLTSHVDPYTGIEFSRKIVLRDGSSRVHVEATMTNRDTKPRRWGIWAHTQVDARRRDGDGFNRRLRVYIPVNSSSANARGFKVMFGAKDDAQFIPSLDSNLLTIHYQRRVGKVGVDSPAGWIATVDGESGYAFIQRFTYHPGREYPDASSVEVWTSGPGTIQAWGRKVEIKDDVVEAPHLIEPELLSPIAALRPGESYTFPYDWYAANVGGDFPIRFCDEAACMSEPMQVRAAKGQVRFAGRFAILQDGFAEVTFLDAEGGPVAAAAVMPVSPRAPLVLEASAFNGASIPVRARKVALRFLDAARQPLANPVTVEIR